MTQHLGQEQTQAKLAGTIKRRDGDRCPSVARGSARCRPGSPRLRSTTSFRPSIGLTPSHCLSTGSPSSGSSLKPFSARMRRSDSPGRCTLAVSARARYRCPFVVLVLTPDAATARSAAEPVDLGGGNAWRSLVVGPEGIPVVTDLAVATREPHLAVLSVMAHGRDPDVPTVVAVATAAADAMFCADTVLPRRCRQKELRDAAGKRAAPD